MDSTGDESIRRARAARFTTVPIVLAGAIAMTAGLSGPAAHAEPRHGGNEQRRHTTPDRSSDDGPVFSTPLGRTRTVMTTAAATTTTVPDTYTVRQGDTISSIATRYGISAQEILVRNGLAWNTIIHPGQSLRLTTTRVVAATEASGTSQSGGTSGYRVRDGDTVTAIAAREGVSTHTLLSANHLSGSSVIYSGQTLKIPTADSTDSTTASAASQSTPATKQSVTVAVGDTAATIAAAHGVTVPALLAANGLTYTSTIYAGSSLVIPDAGGLTTEQRQNAATITSVGRSLGVPRRGIVIALAAAMQESGLRNLSGGDRDSVGVFQQRPSQGWGTADKLMNVAYAARLFFGGPHNPNAGTTNGLLDVTGWTTMDVTDAAQAVQHSAYPKAYGQWEKRADGWLASL